MADSAPPSRLAYDELASPHELYGDCQAAGANLPQHAPLLGTPPSAVPAPRHEIAVTDSAARLAGALHLHLN
ncbi:hypothetical protein [Nocardioides speluncae]|uniref:hypothetical protein n=1 Tax=Nocardioides speluncae TaxID=2670337 RepID=UPI001379A9A8|nr:hypothetical protein [Nocardioides speluncae]